MSSFLIEDRVMETSTTTGTGTFTLAGAVAGYRSFASAIGDGNTCPYLIVALDANGQPTGDWETGIGTFTASGTTLARTTVVRSSNGNSAVSFSAGTKRVAVSMTGRFLTSRTIPRNAKAVSSNTAVSASESGTLFIATAGVNFTLPTIAEDLIFRFLQKSDNEMDVIGSSNIISKNTITGTTIIYNTASQRIGSICQIEAVNISGTLKWLHTSPCPNTFTVS